MIDMIASSIESLYSSLSLTMFVMTFLVALKSNSINFLTGKISKQIWRREHAFLLTTKENQWWTYGVDTPISRLPGSGKMTLYPSCSHPPKGSQLFWWRSSYKSNENRCNIHTCSYESNNPFQFYHDDFVRIFITQNQAKKEEQEGVHKYRYMRYP